MTLLKATGLAKSYKSRAVVRDLSLELANGEVVGLLGPNGAGKTTLLRILATLLRPTGGALVVNGIDAVRFPDRIRALIGMVAHGTYVYEDLTPLENLRFWTMMQDGSATPARLRSALEQVGLDAFADERVRMLSAGMKRRLALARVMLNEPRVLLLDEPFTGLDARGRTWLGQFLRTFKSTGGVVVMVSHSFGVALEVADRVAILCGGRLALDRPCGDLSLADLNKLYDDLTESMDS